MIKEMVIGDILKSPFNNIIFAVNTEGFNDGGFAGLVTRTLWPELANTGGNNLGEVLIKHVKKDKNDLTGRTFYAVVCHSLKGGWGQSSRVLENALRDKIPNEPCAVVKIGGGLIGQMSGAPVGELLKVMAGAKQELTVYSL